MARSVEKVTCIITRRGGDRGDEVVVFDHPLAGVQVPAGTSLPGENAADAALREGWEETGIPGLAVAAELKSLAEATPGCGHGRLAADAVVDDRLFTRGHAATVLDSNAQELLVEVDGKRGWIAADAYCDDVVRHLVQLESDAATPREWWVVTPDGGGLCWRCRWASLDGDLGLVEGQSEWIKEVRGSLSARTDARHFEVPDHPLCNSTSHVQFWGFPGVERRFVVSWIPPESAVDDALVRRALVAGRSKDEQILIVSGDGQTMWNFPGGGREPGERIEDTARREVAEEACAAATDLRLIGYQHLLQLDDGNNVVAEELQARFAARVKLQPWDPQFEIRARRLVHVNEVASVIGMWWHPRMLQHILDGAALAWGRSSAELRTDA